MFHTTTLNPIPPVKLKDMNAKASHVQVCKLVQPMNKKKHVVLESSIIELLENCEFIIKRNEKLGIPTNEIKSTALVYLKRSKPQ